jgi:hypothetical protein
VSRRVLSTDPPIVAKTKALIGGRTDVLSLAQGIVWWPPPPEALAAGAAAVQGDPSVNSYGPDEGSPALRQALREKLRDANGLDGYDVIVTSGSNQACLAVLDLNAHCQPPPAGRWPAALLLTRPCRLLKHPRPPPPELTHSPRHIKCGRPLCRWCSRSRTPATGSSSSRPTTSIT